MSLIQMQEAIADNRADLEAAGIRGIDLDYLEDPRIDHRACLANFQKLVEGPLARWREVMANTTIEQLEYLKLVERKHQKVIAAHEARKAIKNFFKGHVLTFFKDAERRSAESREQMRAEAAAMNEGEQMRSEAVEAGPGDL